MAPAKWANDGCPLPMSSVIPGHIYEIRPRNDRRGFDLISDARGFGRGLRLAKSARVLVRVDHVVRFIVDVNHGIM
jgi:hypothetical protein